MLSSISKFSTDSEIGAFAECILDKMLLWGGLLDVRDTTLVGAQLLEADIAEAWQEPEIRKAAAIGGPSRAMQFSWDRTTEMILQANEVSGEMDDEAKALV